MKAVISGRLAATRVLVQARRRSRQGRCSCYERPVILFRATARTKAHFAAVPRRLSRGHIVAPPCQSGAVYAGWRGRSNEYLLGGNRRGARAVKSRLDGKLILDPERS